MFLKTFAKEDQLGFDQSGKQYVQPVYLLFTAWEWAIVWLNDRVTLIFWNQFLDANPCTTTIVNNYLSAVEKLTIS